MGKQIKSEDLTASWRALSGEGAFEGWRTISLGVAARCQIRAGRYFPGNEEAVIVGLTMTSVHLSPPLPSGTGFVVKQLDLGIVSDGLVWFGLMRQPAGKLDFFTMMAADVISALMLVESADDDGFLAIFLGRVRAWQSFMERDSEGVLSTEAEVGLHGELLLLDEIIECGVDPFIAVESWQGPLKGLRDFEFFSGSIEVKTTVSTEAFVAKIASLDQLDDSTTSSLFLAGVRLKLHTSGLNLAQRAEVLRDRLKELPLVLACFENRLLHAGFFPAFSDRYPREFACDTIKIWRVQGDFPRLTPKTVPSSLVAAKYEIAFDQVAGVDALLHDVVMITGAI